MPHYNNLKSTIIVSVYTDDIALQLILDSLKNQSCSNFEIIISEDGKSKKISDTVDIYSKDMANLHHLSQVDAGFRKNTALNRALKAAKTEHIIFIDGDCIPHREFIAAHQACSNPGIAFSGRRLELGNKFSSNLRLKKIKISHLTNNFLYFLNIIPLLLDNTKNIEAGFYSPTLQFFTKNFPIKILGCNFSCNKNDLIRINGFNEEYVYPGTGEDSDIDWRLGKSGVDIKRVKFSAIQYHLYHPRSYGVSKENNALFEKTRLSNHYSCIHGLAHLPTAEAGFMIDANQRNRMNVDNNYNTLLYNKVSSKNFFPKHVSEIGVWHPNTSNVYLYINDGVRTTLVEPDPESIELIKHKFKDASNVTLHEAAICDFNGEVELYKRESSTFLTTLPGSPALSNDNVDLDETDKFTAKAMLFSEIDDGTIDLISIDIEGGEWFVNKNMKSRPAVVTIRWLLIGFFANDLTMLFIAQLIHAFSFGVFHSVGISLAHKYFTGSHQGRGQALYSSVSFGAGVAVGSLISGLVWDKWGAGVLFVFASCCTMLSLVIVWYFIKPSEKAGVATI